MMLALHTPRLVRSLQLFASLTLAPALLAGCADPGDEPALVADGSAVRRFDKAPKRNDPAPTATATATPAPTSTVEPTATPTPFPGTDDPPIVRDPPGADCGAIATFETGKSPSLILH